MAKKKSENITPKLEDFASSIIKNMEKNQKLSMSLPVRSLSNVYFDEKDNVIRLGDKTSARSFMNVAHAKRFMQTLLIASKCKEIIKDDAMISIRDMFYNLKHTIGNSKENTFDDQSESDPLIEDLECSLDVLREQLNLEASRRGYMVGNITIEDNGDKINCRKMGTGGYSIPSIVEENIIKFDKVDADFILVVEKDAVQSRLNQDKFWKKHNCILVTGQGMAPRGVRRLLNRLSQEYKIPVYIFADNDPWGYYIYSVYKKGSINLSYLSNELAIPDCRFIGLSSTDPETFNLPENVAIKLTPNDIKRAKEILGYDWFQTKPWQKEIKLMLKNNVKYELEALSSKNIRFVTNEYLPQKLEKKEFLH